MIPEFVMSLDRSVIVPHFGAGFFREAPMAAEVCPSIHLDASFSPRGWHRIICGAQQTALDELGVEAEVSAKIFGGNFERIFP